MAVVLLYKKRRFRRQMQSQGRFVTLTDLVARLESGSGTLIEETGPNGAYRIWWTEDGMDGAPSLHAEVVAVFEDERARAENLRRFQDYLDEHRGKALLTPITPRHARSKTLARRFRQVKRVVIVRPSMVDVTLPPASTP